MPSVSEAGEGRTSNRMNTLGNQFKVQLNGCVKYWRWGVLFRTVGATLIDCVSSGDGSVRTRGWQQLRWNSLIVICWREIKQYISVVLSSMIVNSTFNNYYNFIPTRLALRQV